jgi:hypothetical protein
LAEVLLLLVAVDRFGAVGDADEELFLFDELTVLVVPDCCL